MTEIWKVTCRSRRLAQQCEGIFGFKDTENEMLEVALQAGWKRVNQHGWFCPACLERKKECPQTIQKQ